jgi:uncharacterized protein (TIGR01244 family)
MSVDPDDIPCWQRLDARATSSGRIAAEDIARLASIGVRHVINLALAESPGGLADEDRLMAEAGLRYTHIPVAFDAPEEGHFQAFCAAFDADDEPVHVHCIMNWRVSAFFYRYNRERGMSESEARALMERQWTPEATEYKPWAEFVAKGDS